MLLRICGLWYRSSRRRRHLWRGFGMSMFYYSESGRKIAERNVRWMDDANVTRTPTILYRNPRTAIKPSGDLRDGTSPRRHYLPEHSATRTNSHWDYIIYLWWRRGECVIMFSQCIWLDSLWRLPFTVHVPEIVFTHVIRKIALLLKVEGGARDPHPSYSRWISAT